MKYYQEETFLKDLEYLVNIDSGSGNVSGIAAVADFFAERFRSLGLEVTVHDQGETAGPCVEARHIASNESRGGNSVENADCGNSNSQSNEKTFDILMAGHMDTVFPDGTAAARPFSIKDSRAFGPGVADMKSGDLLTLSLSQFLLNHRPELSFCIALNGDEEVGSPSSREWLDQLGRQSRYCFVFEPGRAGGEFVKKRKGVAEFEITFHGRAAHAGVAPEKGASAIVELARWVSELAKLNRYDIGTSVNTGIIRGGTASNVVAEQAGAVIDIRYEISSELERIEAVMKQLQRHPSVPGVTVEIKTNPGFPPMNPNPVTERLIALMEEEGKRLNIPTLFLATGGASDANHLSTPDLPVMDACGPQGSGFHSDQEYIELDSIKQRLALLTAVFSRL